MLTELIGKEANKIDERGTGQITDPDDYPLRLGERGSIWSELELPVLRELGATAVAERLEVGASQVFKQLSQTTPPRKRLSKERYQRLAIEHARQQVHSRAVAIPSEWRAILWQYQRELQQRGSARRLCAEREEVAITQDTRANARHCSSRCRQAASRERLAA